MWKNNTAPGAAGPVTSLHRTTRASSANMIALPLPATPPPPPPGWTQKRGKGRLTFHRILLGAHDVDQGALQGVHVETVVHSGAVLEKHTGVSGAGRKHSTHVAGEWLIPHVSSTRLRFGWEIIKPLKRGYLA